MKHFAKRALSLLLILCMVAALFAGLTTASAANQLRRGTVCTSLSAQAKAYYTGNYTYDTMSKLQGGTTSCLTTVNSAMYKQLKTLMSSTMTNSVSYKSLTSYWPDTDNSNFFYSNTSYSGTVSREHVWPKSRASFYQSNGGSDLHHLRPENDGVNSARYNYTMGNVKGVIPGCSTYTFGGQTVLWYSKGNDLVEVADYVKGDVARILLYVYVRWGERNLFENDPNPKAPENGEKDKGGNNGIKVIESLDTLLEWCELDPVDTWEMKRNDEVQNIQHNRNVFIDYPEYAWLLFGQRLPADMTTPSGEAKAAAASCKHEHIEHEFKAATCTEGGYDREVCKDCGMDLKGTATPALGHSFENGKCTRCGAADPNVKPANTPKYTDFSDLPVISWYKDAVAYALENGLMNGVARREFDPEGELTRAMFVTILYRAATSPDMTGKTTGFSDVPANEWYSAAVVWATENGIVNGTSATTFEPDAPITREQIATILFRYSKAERTDKTLAAFPDAGTVSSYAYDAMCWAVSEGLINGSDGKLVPQDNATRVQIAAILMRYLQK